MGGVPCVSLSVLRFPIELPQDLSEGAADAFMQTLAWALTTYDKIVHSQRYQDY
ncbi:hypothetical protein IQ22_02431 [Pseudomonas duriflava]|uniref:Uncharacterized protein n=1 Tax=Pseudomonas duriflava TaxID=459528 RepID=A0A562QAN6_9PSED|nr:hypothetical protein IQ22_02431 [Pseudomonas duriflava]